jgi:hypothetical protein
MKAQAAPASAGNSRGCAWARGSGCLARVPGLGAGPHPWNRSPTRDHKREPSCNLGHSGLLAEATH